MGRTISSLLCLAALFVIGIQAAQAQRRVALVIGNSAYEHTTPLANPRNDAESIAASLERMGFEVISGFDLDRARFESAIRDFARALRGAAAGVFYYAGHGLQVSGINYLIPVSARLVDEADLDFEALPLEAVLKQMERETKTSIVFLDACRNNPLATRLSRSMGTRSTAVSRGLARIDAGTGSFIAFATEPGNVALDGEGANSPFTEAVLKHIETPGLDVALLLRKVRREVSTTTGGRQVPWNNSSLTNDFYFNPRGAPGPGAVTDGGQSTGPDGNWTQGLDAIRRELEQLRKSKAEPKPPAQDPAAQAWELIKNVDSPAVFQAFIERYPNSAYADFARARMRELQQQANRSPPQQQPPVYQPPQPPAYQPPAVRVEPSFSCAKAGMPAEFAICQSSTLAQLDQQLAQLYKYRRSASRGSRRQALVSRQRAWLLQRNACGSNANCIAQRYYEQIQYLGQ